jgi:hypothetical protein
VKNLFSFLLAISFSACAFGQELHLNGEVFNKADKKPIQGAFVEVNYTGQKTQTDSLGHFSVAIPKKHGSLVVTHPDFDPIIAQFNYPRSGTNFNFKVGLYSKAYFLSESNASESKNKDSRNFSGKVFNEQSLLPVPGVSVWVLKANKEVFTDAAGFYSLVLPKGPQFLFISHQGFYPKKAALSPPFNRQFNFGLLSIADDSIKKVRVKNEMDSIRQVNKNAISFFPVQIILGGVALQYERHFKNIKNSIGMYGAAYLYGWAGNDSRYTGFKLAPYFRHYAWMKSKKSFFFDYQLMVGYFDFHPLAYNYDYGYYRVYKDVNFWTAGGGISLGWMMRTPRSTRNFMSISLGLQYFPMYVPNKLESDAHSAGNLNYTAGKTWWYIWGPGSVVQVKITFGRIF